jgi:hypothetical protein
MHAELSVLALSESLLDLRLTRGDIISCAFRH